MAVGRLVDTSADVVAAVLVDAAGTLVEASEADAGRARELGELARELVERADAAGGEPVEQIEVQVGEGSVFAVRSPRHVLACVARRAALPALVLYDLRHGLAELERAE
jgi:predicted regulator of Ras-like GTPase activity (Roadblock/LC7/MglB family)